ncbi:hypothetical protein FAZ15_11420 [Sphingobacterium olei]|uniref:Uncharacterized protein n=1 Tax=Sphingobacterium olei TaxID=2571155 RepID=A0A4U0P080_9SPHI|nr:hypothetical protein [Sphingobacterium olei]TJZ60597.1 hypothetical protein FAZ15_11420 [Sphingobacterium olei]
MRKIIPIKKTLSFILLICLGHPLFSQSLQVDSATFEQQRKRVNTLLDERSRKFEEYNISLDQKTGVFGIFKTKGDMQKSIDILKTIVINDNKIFIETRKLLDLKDIEREKFQKLATEFDVQVTAYMKTISKLQHENDKFKDEIKNLKNQGHSGNNIQYISYFIIAALGFIIFRQYKALKSQKVTKV